MVGAQRHREGGLLRRRTGWLDLKSGRAVTSRQGAANISTMRHLGTRVLPDGRGRAWGDGAPVRRGRDPTGRSQ